MCSYQAYAGRSALSGRRHSTYLRVPLNYPLRLRRAFFRGRTKCAGGPPPPSSCVRARAASFCPLAGRHGRHRVGLEEAVTTSRQAPQLHHSTLQESLPCTSVHALHRQHKARPAGARADLTLPACASQVDGAVAEGSWLRPTGRSRLIDELQVSC